VNTPSSRFSRWISLPLALGLAVVSMGAQGRPPAPDPVRQVRTALAQGEVDEARRIAAGTTAEAARALALSLIDIFEGKYEDARERLAPVATRQPLGDASLELGLLDLRTGRVEAGQQRLDRIAAVRTFNSPEDYFRLARAARAIREFLLANDAYQRIADVARADIQTEWGDMFLERHQPGDAVTNYKQALEIDERWVPAWLGLSRALADENPPASRDALEKARAQAADHPDVWLVTAEQQLEADDVAAAREALDHLARVRPNSLEEIGLRAALAYEEGGLLAVDEIAAQVRALNPRSGIAYRTAGEQAAREYRFDDAAALARKAVDIDPTDPVSQFSLGLYLLRTGDEAAARTALETSWDLDKSAPMTKNLLDLLDDIDTFEVVPNGEFLFKFHKNEAPVLKTYALPLADSAYQEFSQRYGFKPQGPILVEVFPEHDDFAVRTLGLPGLVGALGACFGRVVTMDSPRARPPGDFSWQATLWHELAHVFSLQLSEYRVPRWLTEGISTYEEHRRRPAWGRELTLQYARELGANRHFGVKKLPEAFKRPESLALAYFEASLVVEHLVALNGDSGLRTLLLAYAEGAKDAEAFSKAFARSIDDVDGSFQTFVKERYGKLASAMAAPEKQVPPTDLDALRARAEASPDNFVSQLTYGQALLQSGDVAAARTRLERAAALAPEASGDTSPRMLLAQIAETEKDPARARRELRALLDHDHTNIVAARRLAELAAAAGEEAEETMALKLVAELDPFDANVHGKLGRRLMATREYAAALIEFQAALALGPVNRAEAHADAAEALIALGRPQEARREVLRSLQEAPTYARAQDLLLRIQGGAE
jgi:tetratricopeptide (TPR) repeat protein